MTLPLSGAKIRASDLATIFPLNTDGWTAFTPTLTQGAAVTKTVSSARYMRVGRWITAQVLLTVTGPGTAATGINIGLPVTALAAINYGSGYVGDASTGLFYTGTAYPISTTTTAILIGNGAGLNNVAGAAGFTAALAVGDTISLNLSYEAAS